MQKLLKDYGHEVKTGHLYEIFSKLSGEKSWNVAKVKNISFQKELNLDTDYENTQNINEHIKMLWDKELNQLNENELLFGYSLEKRTIVKRDFTKFPNSLFVGSMGTGKTNAQISTLKSFINKPNSIAYICDAIKGAQDYQNMFSNPKVIPVLDDKLKLIETIDSVHLELKRRLKIFDESEVFSLEGYKNKTGIELDRVLIVLEEFDYICKNLLVKGIELTTLGNKIKDILRTGRTLGIWVSACSQKSITSDILEPLLRGFCNRFIFQISSADAEILINGAGELIKHLTQEDRGLCISEDGIIHFPFTS